MIWSIFSIHDTMRLEINQTPALTFLGVHSPQPLLQDLQAGTKHCPNIPGAHKCPCIHTPYQGDNSQQMLRKRQQASKLKAFPSIPKEIAIERLELTSYHKNKSTTNHWMTINKTGTHKMMFYIQTKRVQNEMVGGYFHDIINHVVGGWPRN